MAPDIEVVFAISLTPRHGGENWELVQKNLRRTLASIRGSTRKSYRIAIACHDVPGTAGVEGEDIDVLTVPFPVERDVMRRKLDQIRKRRFIGAWLRYRLNENDGAYVMFLDADDLVHRDLVQYVLSDNNRRSYVADTGYIFDATTGLVERKMTRFDTICGSCFVSWFQRSELPRSWEDAGCVYSQFDLHREFIETATRLGKAPEPFPMPAFVYFANHGVSLRTMEFNGVREVDLSSLLPPRQARKILAQDFSCDDLAQTAASTPRFLVGVLTAGSRRIGRCLTKFISRAQSTEVRPKQADTVREELRARPSVNEISG